MSHFQLQIGSNATPKKWTSLRICAVCSASLLFAVHSFRIFRIFTSDTFLILYQPFTSLFFFFFFFFVFRLRKILHNEMFPLITSHAELSLSVSNAYHYNYY